MVQQGGLSDAELVRRALGAATPEQRRAAFADIADRYHVTVLRQCARWFPHPEEAQDVCQAAFEAAFTLLTAGKAPERPDKLAGWLIEIARRRGQEYRRKDISAGVSWAILPEGQSLDEVEDDEEPRSGSAIRRAHVNRLVKTVVTTLTARQQEVYQLRYSGELTGKQVAERLGISDKAASNEITHVQDLIAKGFGALILLQEGRKYCPDLARIIETVPAEVGTTALNAALRKQIVNHFDNCSVCDDCRTCNAKRRELAGPYVPAMIPVLFAADLHDRVTEMIDRITRQAIQHPPSHPGSGIPADAGTGLTVDAAAAEDAATAPGAGQAAVLLTARRHSTQLGHTLRRRPAATAGIVALVLVAAGISAAILASGGGSSTKIHTAAAKSGGSSSPMPDHYQADRSSSIPDGYQADRDASAGIASALATAGQTHREVLVVFGANWCPDCRALDTMFHSPQVEPLLTSDYDVVAVDVGKWNLNLGVAARYVDLHTSGIPALVVLDPSGRVITTTNDGSFANARTMTPSEVAAFLSKWAPGAAQ
jgi:RNA polymerase sigma factor (sigma-70 family)